MANKYFTDITLGLLVNRIKEYVTNAVSTKANSTHIHSISNITNLQSSLNGKADTAHNHSASDIISGTFSSDRLPIISIFNGGTGANTVENAQKNLGILTLDDIANLCFWKRYVKKTSGLPDISILTSGGFTCKYADSIIVTEDGVSLENEQELTITYSTSGLTEENMSALEILKGKFVLEKKTTGWTTNVIFVHSDSSFSTYRSTGTYAVTYLRATVITKITNGTVDKYVAAKENTYPTLGEHTDGYFYEYVKRITE